MWRKVTEQKKKDYYCDFYDKSEGTTFKKEHSLCLIISCSGNWVTMTLGKNHIFVMIPGRGPTHGRNHGYSLLRESHSKDSRRLSKTLRFLVVPQLRLIPDMDIYLWLSTLMLTNLEKFFYNYMCKISISHTNWERKYFFV